MESEQQCPIQIFAVQEPASKSDSSRSCQCIAMQFPGCNQLEAMLKKKNAVLVDGVVLNGQTIDSKAREQFFEKAFRMIIEEAVCKATDVTEKVCEWQPPEKLKKLLDLELRDSGEPHQTLLQLCQSVIHYSVKTGHPRFFNQLYAGMDHYSLVARFITEALNPSVYTYEVSPVFLLVEEATLKKMIEFIGWKEGDGIFSPGGSISNMYATNLARYKCCPDVKERGLSGVQRLVMFTSEESHYSMKKAAAFLGIGTQNVYFVKVDDRGKMIPEELEEQIQRAKQEGAKPFLVCATAGTTVLGAFDPLDKLADICEHHGLWFHVDASWGGAALLSKKHCKLLKGIHRYLVAEIKKREGFQLIMEPEYANVCFWYIPPSLRNMEQDQEFWQKLHRVAPEIKERMMKKGSMMLGYQPHQGKVNFFRQIVISSQVRREDMDFLLDEIDLLGKDL